MFCFQIVSQKWVDGLNSNLPCGCNWFQGVPYFKVTLNSHVLKSYLLSLHFLVFHRVY